MRSLIYLFQVSACTGIFYGCYYLLLRRFTFFTINRWYLLATLVASFVIPLLTITVHKQSAPIVIQQAISDNQDFPVSVVSAIAPVAQGNSAMHWVQLIETGYLIVTIMLFIRLIVILSSFFYKLKGLDINKIGYIRVITGNNKLQNGSFLNYIFLDNEGLSAIEAKRILEHEMLHARFFHSVDRILVKSAQIVLWFNPFIYGYAYAIEENHEFEVDNEIGKRTDKSAYADMLLHLSVNRQNILFNSFSKAPLKRRIAMLFTKPTYHMKKITYLLVLPVVIISCLAFAKLKNDVQQQRYSVVNGVEKLKGNIKVLIDGKPYDADILYKISSTCIKTTRFSFNSSGSKNGKVKTTEAVVNIITYHGEITYMTKWELDSLKQVRTIPDGQFYTRLKLRDNKGKRYDEVIIKIMRGYVAASFEANKKVGFYVGDTYYTEKQVSEFSDEQIKALGAEASVDVPATPAYSAKHVAAMFFLKPLVIDTTSNKPKVKIKNTRQPVKQVTVKKGVETDYATAVNYRNITPAEKQIMEKTLTNPGASFFNRFHFDRPNGRGFDVITFKKGDKGEMAYLDAGEKTGTFIDGKFYNEDAIKKLSPEKIAALTSDSGADHSKFEKMPDDGNYAVPFYFKTKTK